MFVSDNNHNKTSVHNSLSVTQCNDQNHMIAILVPKEYGKKTNLT